MGRFNKRLLPGFNGRQWLSIPTLSSVSTTSFRAQMAEDFASHMALVFRYVFIGRLLALGTSSQGRTHLLRFHLTPHLFSYFTSWGTL